MLTIKLNKHGAICPKEYEDELSKELTIVDESKYGNKVCCPCVKSNKGLIVPKHALKNFLDGKGLLYQTKTFYAKPNRVSFEFKNTLKGGKERIIDFLMNGVFTKPNIASGWGTALINLKAGLGKTYLAAKLIEKLGLNTLYVVHNKHMQNQAYADLKDCLGECVRMDTKSKKNTAPFKGITVLVINSAIKIDVDEYSLVIMDEVHRYCSETFRKIFYKCNWCIVGMSATTDERNDSLDLLYRYFLGEVIYANEIATVDDVEFSITVKAIHYTGCEEYTKNIVHKSTEVLFCPDMYNQFMKDERRKALLSREIYELYKCGDNIFVFGHEIQHLKDMMKIMEGVGVSGDIMGLLVGGSAKSSKIEDWQIIFTTYGYSGTGVSIDKMNAMVFLTPRKTGLEQIVGRILRRSGDQSIPRKVIDVIDSNTALKHQYKNRQRAYELYGAKIEHEYISYNNKKM